MEHAFVTSRGIWNRIQWYGLYVMSRAFFLLVLYFGF